ncbi:MAG: TetR/AcrR family transcriptional regulator [Acidimicrobiia bacterium]
MTEVVDAIVEPGATCRKPGRPRSSEADAAILEAALELYADHGFEALTVDGVACRAGVSKATIYRRYPSKIDLVLSAAAHYSAEQALMPDTGNLRGDVRAVVGNLGRLLSDPIIGKIVARLGGEAIRNPELAAAHREFVRSRRALNLTVVQRAIERGELVPDADPEFVVDLIAAPAFYRTLITGGPVDDALADRIVEVVERAFGSRA